MIFDKRVVVIGPFPPPVHGMSKNLEIFHNDVSKISPVFKIDVSPGALDRSGLYHFKKLLKVIAGLLKLLLVGFFTRSVYIPPDAGFGMFYTCLFVCVARLFGAPVYLHHRSFAYVYKKNLLMLFLSRILGGRGGHIFLCELMAEKFSVLYPTLNFSIVSNSMHVHEFAKTRSSRKFKGKLCLGFLSNLSPEKGLFEAIDAFVEAKKSGLNVVFKLGGAVSDDFVMKRINEVSALFPDFYYSGKVSDREDFFSDVDVFVFPTNYVNEAQPNVLFEAQAFGCPVISVDRGCIFSDISCGAGGYVVPLQSFVRDAVDIINSYFSHPFLFEQDSTFALQSINEKCQTSLDAYKLLVNDVAYGYPLGGEG